jgi:hypothetical protein
MEKVINTLKNFSPRHNDQWWKNLLVYALTPLLIIIFGLWVFSRPAVLFPSDSVKWPDGYVFAGTADNGQTILRKRGGSDQDTIWFGDAIAIASNLSREDSIDIGWVESGPGGQLTWPGEDLSGELSDESVYIGDDQEDDSMYKEEPVEEDEAMPTKAIWSAKGTAPSVKSVSFDATQWVCPTQIASLREARTVAAALDYLGYDIPDGNAACTGPDWDPLWLAIDSFVCDQALPDSVDWLEISAVLQREYRAEAQRREVVRAAQDFQSEESYTAKGVSSLPFVFVQPDTVQGRVIVLDSATNLVGLQIIVQESESGHRNPIDSTSTCVQKKY